MAKRLIAVIDIGSLTARLKIFEVGSQGKPRTIEAVRKYISVGTKSYKTGVILPEQVNELCDCLLSFDQKCREYKVSKVFCISTSVFRDAWNKDVVLDQIKTRTGFKISILDNSMERYYQNLAVKEIYFDNSMIFHEGTMILDIGAGSMQATVYDKDEFIFSQNMVLGSLRIYEMLSDLQNRTTHYEDVLEEFIAQDLDEYHAIEPKGITYKHLIAFSGEMGFIKLLAGKDSVKSCILSKEEFLGVYEYLLKTRPTDLTLNNSIPSFIAPLLLPSALIIRNMLEYTGVNSIYMPHASLSDGIAYNYCYEFYNLEPKINPELEIVSAARNIAKRYKTDKKHIEFVRNAAMDIFDASTKVSGLKRRERLLLELSVILHEIGKFVHAKNHNDAAYSLIRNTDFIGINEDELEIIALTVCLYPKEDAYDNPYYRYLPAEKKVLVSKLTSILRIADALDSSHREKIEKMSVSVQGDKLHIYCESKSDVSFEEWSFEHRSDLFEEVMGISAELRVRRLV